MCSPLSCAGLRIKPVTFFIAVFVTGAIHGRTLVEFRENRLSSMNFKCKSPQPRSVPITELEMTTQSRHIVPAYVVLHRCDMGSGCCSQGVAFRCVPAEGSVEEVDVQFNVTEQFMNGTYEARLEIVTATNHTACVCMKHTDISGINSSSNFSLPHGEIRSMVGDKVRHKVNGLDITPYSVAGKKSVGDFSNEVGGSWLSNETSSDKLDGDEILEEKPPKSNFCKLVVTTLVIITIFSVLFYFYLYPSRHRWRIAATQMYRDRVIPFIERRRPRG